MTLTQHWGYLNLTRNRFYLLFLAKVVVGYSQIISSRLCVRLNQGWGTYLLSRAA